MTGDAINLPEDFTSFHPEMDAEFQKLAEDNLNFVTPTYINSFIEGFERDPDYKKRAYEDRLTIDEDVQIVGTDWLGMDKIKSTYGYIDVNEQGEWLINDIKFSLGCTGEYGKVRNVDDIAHGSLEYIMNQYRGLVKREITKKVAVLKSTIEKNLNL